MLRGWALTEQGQIEEGIAQLCQGIASWRAGARCLEPYFLSLLVEAYMRGHRPEALTALAEALSVTEQTREGYVEAELYRLKGELLLGSAEAEACFHQAIAIARRQKAKSFGLRAVMSMSRLYQKQGRQTEAQRILAEIYGWFTEGFDTADLREAAALLEELGTEPSEAGLSRKSERGTSPTG
jgi:predicted ATPase